MRNIILIAIVLFISSCGSVKYTVRLFNGSTITAVDDSGRDPSISDTVYLGSYTINKWNIMNEELGPDTMYVTSWTNADSTTETYISTRRSGVVIDIR